MFLKDYKQVFKRSKMSIVRIVITCLFVLGITDKAKLNDIFNCFSNLSTFNINSLGLVFTNLCNITRIIALDYSISIGIGYFVLEFALCVVTLKTVFMFISLFINKHSKSDYRTSSVDLKPCVQPSNDIYLQTNKLIC